MHSSKHRAAKIACDFCNLPLTNTMHEALNIKQARGRYLQLTFIVRSPAGNWSNLGIVYNLTAT